MSVLLVLLLAAAEPDCENISNQGEMTECALIDYRKADAALNAQWKITLAAVRKSDKAEAGNPDRGSREKDLLEAQRAWLTYRDAHCASLYPYGSTMQLDYTMHVWCLTELTETRTAQLEEIASAK